MIYGVGSDIVAIGRMRQAIERWGGKLLARLFTEAECAYCEGRPPRYQHYAARFAAKESLLKALGVGWRGGVRWLDMEVVADGQGRPLMRLTGVTASLAGLAGVNRILLSLSHDGDYALATVILVQ